MVDRTLHNSVTEYFDIPEESQLPVLENIYCSEAVEEIKKHMVKYANKDATQMEDDIIKMKSQGQMINIWPESSSEEESTFWIPEKLMNSHGAFMRKQLSFKSEYQKFANKILREVARKNKSGKEIVFVGLHARRTDYIGFSKRILKKKIAGKSHFLDGIEYYQEEFPDEQVYFIAVSDDMDWMRKHLGNIDGVVMAGMADKSSQDILPYGLDPIGVDLCLLASCNHTIMSQGQFGQWAAFLAGGDVYSTYGPLVWNILKNSDEL